jgi:hypothetical protein
MAFYRFHVCDPVKRIDGHGHDGAALADDIDAMLFAAGIIQRLIREYPSVPRNWAIDQGQRRDASGRCFVVRGRLAGLAAAALGLRPAQRGA